MNNFYNMHLPSLAQKTSIAKYSIDQTWRNLLTDSYSSTQVSQY